MRTVVARLRYKIIKGDRLGKREISKEKRDMSRTEKGRYIGSYMGKSNSPKNPTTHRPIYAPIQPVTDTSHTPTHPFQPTNTHPQSQSYPPNTIPNPKPSHPGQHAHTFFQPDRKG